MIGFPLLKWTLVCTNWLIFAFLVILMCEHYYAGNSLKSWSFIFYILSFAWLILKGIFWLLTVLTGRTWEAFEFYVLYWVPVPLEICSFMLVPLFFVNMLYPRKWNYYKIYIRPVYIAVTCGLTILTIIWALLAAVSLESQHKCIHKFLSDSDDADDDANEDEDASVSSCFRTEFTGDMFRSITATCFLFLSFTQGWFGIKLHHLNDWQQLGMIATQKENLTYLNVFLCLSFISRIIYQVMAIFWDFRFANIPLNGSKDVQFMSFLMIILWDYLPTVLLLLYVVSPSLQGGIFAPRARSGSRTFSIDESDPYGRGRDRSDTGFTSDGGEGTGGRLISGGDDGGEESMWAYMQRVARNFQALVAGRGGSSQESDEQHARVRVNYGTDGDSPSLLYGSDAFSSPLRDPNYFNENDPLLMSSTSNRYPGSNWHGEGSSNTVSMDALQRFQQAPLLPIAQQRNSFRGAYPYQQSDQDLSNHHNQSSTNAHMRTDQFSQNANSKQNCPPLHQHQQRNQHVLAPSQMSWGRNNNDANFDPDLYAFSAIPRHGSAGSFDSSTSNRGGFSPLDLQLQRDTSAQKYAAYAPRAPPASTTESSSGSSISKLGNPPSALDNALCAWKKKPQSSLRVATQYDGGDMFRLASPSMAHLMSPSAMSHDTPPSSDAPSDFTLPSGLPSSRATHTRALSSSSRSNSGGGNSRANANLLSQNIPQQQQQQHHQRPPTGQEGGDRGQLSSRPVLRNSSGNFLNLANLAEEVDSSSNGKTKNTSVSDGSKSTNSTTDGKSIGSSTLS